MTTIKRFIQRIASQTAQNQGMQMGAGPGQAQNSLWSYGCLDATNTTAVLTDGTHVDAVITGNPAPCGPCMRLPNGKYLFPGIEVAQQSADGSPSGGLWLYKGTNYYVRKALDRKFYQYTPPTVNTYLTAPAPNEYIVDTGLRLSTNFFSSKSEWLNYATRIAYFDETYSDMNYGDLAIDWAIVSPKYKTEGDVNTIENTVVSSGSYVFPSSSLSLVPNPTNSNVFVMSGGYNESVVVPSGSQYEWTIVNVQTYVPDTDSGSTTEYNEHYRNERNVVPAALAPQEAGMVARYKNERQVDAMDLVTSYVQINSPFSAKVISSEVTTFAGTFTSTFSETFGPDEDNLTTVETPMTGEWEAVTTVEHTWGNTINGFRTHTITTTYAITKAELITYIPIGVGQAIDRLNSGGPLGGIDLVTNPSPPFGYLTIYAHPPVDFDGATLGSVPSDALFFLTQNPSFNPAYQVDLNVAELDETNYFADLPWQSVVVESEEVPGYYSLPPYSTTRTQNKLVSITEFNTNGRVVQSPLYYDGETWRTESVDTDTSTTPVVLNYSNSAFGGYDAYDATYPVTLTNTTNGIAVTDHSQVNFNKFPAISTFLGPPSAGSLYKTSVDNGLVFFLGEGTKLAKATYDLSQAGMIQSKPFAAMDFHVSNQELDVIVTSPTVFEMANADSGNFTLTAKPKQINVFSYKPYNLFVPPPITNQYMTFWTRDTENNTWVKGKQIDEDYTDDPLVYPPDVFGASQVACFRMF